MGYRRAYDYYMVVYMNVETITIIFLAFIVIGSLIAVETPNLLSAVVCLGVVDIGFTILFLLLKAPDIAITQMVVEVVCLIILIRATVNRDKSADTGERKLFGLMTTGAIIIILFMFIMNVVPLFGEFGNPIFTRVENAPSQTYISKCLEDTGAANAVSAVILDYRGYDTLGEATILFASVIGAIALLRKKPRKKINEPDDSDSLSVVKDE